MTRRVLANAAVTLVLTLTLGTAAHGTAPNAWAEGCLGATYQRAVRHAAGAVVGVISKVGVSDFGVSFVSQVAVERVVGSKSGLHARPAAMVVAARHTRATAGAAATTRPWWALALSSCWT